MEPTLNVYGWVVLVSLLGFWALGLVMRWLDRRNFARQRPPGLERVYDEEQYARARSYTGVRSRFGALVATFDLIVLLAFWGLGGFGWLDETVRSLADRWFGGHPIAIGLGFVGALGVGQALLALPFQVWSTFVIEERFGFNRTTLRTFVVDLIKGALVGVVLGTPLLAAVLAFFHYGGPQAWLWAWLFVTVFVVAVQYVVPTWIMPLFNKFEPLEDGELRERLTEYAEEVEFPLQEVFVIDGSRRSNKANAFFTGFGKRKRIALFDTLVESHTVPELLAVLAHEVGHYKKKHLVIGMALSIVQTGFMLWLFGTAIRQEGLFRAFGVGQPSVWAGMVFFGLLMAPLGLVLGPLASYISRRHEFQADRWAVETTGHAKELVSALLKLSTDNLAHPTPHPLRVAMEYSHPPLLVRIGAIEELEPS